MDFDFSSKESVMKDVVANSIEDITFSIVDSLPAQYVDEKSPSIDSFITVAYDATDIVMKLSLTTEYLKNVIMTLYPQVENHAEYYEDTIDEIANTICGTFFRRLETELGDFNLTIPYRSQKKKRVELSCYKFLVDDQHLVKIKILH